MPFQCRIVIVEIQDLGYLSLPEVGKMSVISYFQILTVFRGIVDAHVISLLIGLLYNYPVIERESSFHVVEGNT